jgi:arsenate reductase (glutaredoxin)
MADIIEVWGIPTCGTTRTALKYLEVKKIPHVFKNYREVRPTKALLKEASSTVAEPKKLFNTSGGSYREGGWKEKADGMSLNEITNALLTDPMLIKRPIVKSPKGIVVGYDETKLSAIL